MTSKKRATKERGKKERRRRKKNEEERPTRIDRDKGTRTRWWKKERGEQIEEAECVLTGNRIIDVPSGDRLPPCCLFYFPFPFSLSFLFSPLLKFFIFPFQPFPSSFASIDTLVTDSATQPSGKPNERNLITGGETSSRTRATRENIFAFTCCVTQWNRPTLYRLDTFVTFPAARSLPP